MKNDMNDDVYIRPKNNIAKTSIFGNVFCTFPCQGDVPRFETFSGEDGEAGSRIVAGTR
jgi:hypothetical protein